MRALLISTYELGRQPFGLASPAAWLRDAGVEVSCLDLAVQDLDEARVRAADVIGFYLPMHTATRIATAVLPRVRALNPTASLCAWGLYAPSAAAEMTHHGVSFLAGGEFEARLTEHVLAVRDGTPRPQSATDLGRLEFRLPHRAGLPALSEYASLCMPNGSTRVVGTTEASRGCKHLCRHCPVVPVYGGKFRIVDADVVLADIAQQVAAGAEHITFGDPDFLNGPRHAVEVVRELHAAFPDVTYDVTVKVEHLLQHADLLPLLRDTGCALVTSAVESVDDADLLLLDKGHTRADFERAVLLCREAGLDLQPTFLPFTPWTTLSGYRELLRTLVDLDLVGQVTSIQLAIRLLIPRDSRLLELPFVSDRVGPYDPAALGHVWTHADPAVDALQAGIQEIVENAAPAGLGRGEIFAAVWEATRSADPAGSLPDLPQLPSRATIPYLSEPWYC